MTRFIGIVGSVLGIALVYSASSETIYEPYTFLTLAGKTAEGFADGTGSSARFNAPVGVALDQAGNAYVAETQNHIIRRVTPQGVVTIFAGAPRQRGSEDGPASTARFDNPRALAFDRSSNLYVADAQNHTIRKITPAGTVSTFAGVTGESGSANGFFNIPSGVAVDSAGNVFVGDYRNRVIRKITPDGTFSTFAGRVGRTGSVDGAGDEARFMGPEGIAIDNSDNLYVADTLASTVRKITPQGFVTTFAGAANLSGSADGSGSSARFYQPQAVAVASNGSVLVADSQNNTIRMITSDGVVTTLAGMPLVFGYKDGAGSEAHFATPRGIAVDPTGNLVVSDARNHNIRRVSATGVVTTLAGATDSIGSTNGVGKVARLNGPSGIALDSARNVYVADTFNRVIRKITPEGIVTTLAGLALSSGSADGTGALARFDAPAGIAVDSKGVIYVTDNSTIRKVTPAGVVTTLAGAPGVIGTDDGSGSSARFNYPQAVAVDSGGNIFVADTFNNSIRKVTSEGLVTTFSGLTGSQPGSGEDQNFYPRGIAIDSSSTIFVADTYNYRIKKITSDGAASVYSGVDFSGNDDGPGAVTFNFPFGVAVDGSGNVYVADTVNHTIRKIHPDGTTSTLGGVPLSPAGADGTGITARFDLPNAIASDAAGRLYVADTYNNSIRVARAGAGSHSRNISTRLRVGNESHVLIGGFIATGNAPKRVLLRGIGPSLAAFGLSGLLADPVLELRDASGNLVASNDNWKIDDATQQSQEDDIRTAELAPGDDLESVIQATVAPQQGYTAILRGKDNQTGLALVEAYDLAEAADAKLANISTRGFVQTGDDVLIGGFILGGGSGGSRVVLRAVGPSLTEAGIIDALANPILALHDANGTLVSSNDNWKIDDQTQQSQEAVVRGTNLAPKNDLESAIVITLPAGAYTAIVTGQAGGQGVALVEIYNLE